MTINELATLDNICEAFYLCSKVSHWKESTQRFKTNLLLEAVDLQDDLLNGTYEVSPTIDFMLNERGKIRNINAPVIRDRVVQKMLMKHILLPTLTHPLIYDNYASLKGRGTSQARNRMDANLNRYIRKHGADGYILQIDIKKYFDSIDHSVLKQLYRKEVHEPIEVMNLIDYIIDTSSKTDKGLNLGSECPQIFAVYYLHPIDIWMKCVCGEHYYGRYMDDIYVISESKEHLQDLLERFKLKLAELKLEVNERKTHIAKLSHGFTFLQIKYGIEGRKIIKRLTHAKIVRERRRLKAFRRLTDKGKMSETKAYTCYKSWKFSAIKDCNACWHSIQSMDRLFSELFPDCQEPEKKLRPDIIDGIFRNAEMEDIEEMRRLMTFENTDLIL